MTPGENVAIQNTPLLRPTSIYRAQRTQPEPNMSPLVLVSKFYSDLSRWAPGLLSGMERVSPFLNCPREIKAHGPFLVALGWERRVDSRDSTGG